MNNKIGLKDYIRIISKWRKLIFWNTFIVTIAAIIISFIIPKKYTSKASLLPPLQGVESMSGSTIASMIGGFGLASLGTTTASDLFAAILKSTTVMDGVIKENDLKKKFKTKTVKDTYARLSKSMTIGVSPEGVISLSATANSPELAQSIVNSYINNLDLVNKDIVMTIGKRNRIFIEKRLDEVKKKLTSIEDSLKRFQELHKTISIEDELRPTLSAIADIKAQIVSNEIKLGMLREYATEENPEIVRIKSELNELSNNLHKMEYNTDNSHLGVGFSVPLNKLPQVSLEMGRLIREVKIQEKLLALLIEQYELAKSQEIKDTPTINVLEFPTKPEKKSYPKRSIIVIISFILSLSAGTLLAFILNWAYNLSETEKTDWKNILGTNNKIKRRI